MPAYVITGGPGSGKTSLLEALGQSGYAIVPEVSRALIIAETQAGGNCLPWVNLRCFAKKCMETMQEDYDKSDPGAITFFDRAMPDVLGYLKVGGVATDGFEREIPDRTNYQKKVFLAPPWEDIYVNDNERWQTFQEACDLSEAINQAYSEAGYEVIRLPFASVSDRVDFVIKTIEHAN